MISNCCHEPDRTMHEGGPDYSDQEICPECKMGCVFIEDTFEDWEYAMAMEPWTEGDDGTTE